MKNLTINRALVAKKKLFLLIPALVLSLVLNAKVTNITPTSPYDTHDNLRLALYYATAGDEIVLADGTYDEHDNYLYFDKDITVRAAEGASPVIDMLTYAQIKSDANVRIEGLKFNGAAQGSYSYYFRFYDNSNTSLELDGCEFYSVKNYVLYGNSSSHTNSLIVNNCYFHNNVKNAIYFEASGTEGVQTCDRLEVRNSTIANTDALTNYTSTIDIRPYGSDVTDAIKVIIDHCTFYNNPTINSDHSAIRPYKLSDVTISNCIFAHPEAYARRATCCYGGTISNCLTFNLTTDASQNAHRQSGGLPVFSGNFTADPLFTDAANGDYSFAGNWVTMKLSPARGTATDGSDLGDPRWYSAEVLPSSNFVAPYAFVGSKALISGNLWYDSENDYLYYNDKSVCGTAKWKIHATRACVVKATLNMNAGTTSGHIFRIELLDANGNHVTEVAEPSQSSAAGDIELTNPLAIPAEGDYTIILHNDQSWSSAKINSITLAYIGGAIVTVPAEELVGEEAVIVNNGHLKVYKLANGDLQYNDNSDPFGEYVYWNINATKYGRMDVTLNVVEPTSGSASGHKFLVELYSDLSGEPIVSTAEPSQKSSTGAISLPALNIPATGNYIVKLTNQTQYSSAILHSIEFAYAGGEVANVPGQILGADAMLLKEDGGTLKMYHAANGDITYNDNGNPTTEYALWNIHADAACELAVKLNIATSGHILTVELYDGTTLLGSAAETEATKWDGGDIALVDHLNIPAAGNYTIKVINSQQWSHGALHGITFTEVVPPTVVTIDEMAENNDAWVSYVGGDAVNVQLNRTIVAGMFNTLCLPFDVDGTQTKAIFGNDVELYTLGTTALEENELTLNVNPATDIYHGTPFLIKTSTDVVNPLFEGVQILSEVPANTTSTAVDFIGNFIKSEVPAGESNLFLGPNDLLYFSQNATEIKGMRAYFHVKVPGAASMIKHARIVTGTNVLTDVKLVNEEKNNDRKMIENGQLIIIRDGIRYNVMGVKLQ